MSDILKGYEILVLLSDCVEGLKAKELSLLLKNESYLKQGTMYNKTLDFLKILFKHGLVEPSIISKRKIYWLISSKGKNIVKILGTEEYRENSSCSRHYQETLDVFFNEKEGDSDV